MAREIGGITYDRPKAEVKGVKGVKPVEQGWSPRAGKARVALLQVDSHGECTAASADWWEMIGGHPGATKGREWLGALAPEDARAIESLLRTSPQDEFSAPIRLLGPGGAVRDAHCKGLPVFGPHQDLSGHVLTVLEAASGADAHGSHEDTARALEERVRELHCLFEISRLVERTGGMSIPKIVEGTVHLLPGALRHPEIAYARITLDEMVYETSPVTDAVWKECVEIKVHGEPAGVLEVGYLMLPGSGILQPLLDDESTLIRSVAQRLGRMAERIIDAERLQEKEEELRTKMTHMTRVAIVGEMAANIAHELNQPLTAITSYAEASRRILGRKKKDLGKLEEALTWIAEEALRAGEIIRHMRELVRARQSQREMQQLNGLIGSIEHLAVLYARLHNAQVDFDLSPELPLVSVDGVQIQQVILNLIRNGIDSANRCESEGPRVMVRTRRLGGGEVRVSVEDNGCGLSRDHEEEVFRPFFTTKEDGMGLGLSISKSIVNGHGGRIWFTPGTDAGTVFHFTIPVHECG
jgi:signal transduction histidine kinase